MTNQDRTTKTQEISKALGRPLTDEQMQYVYEDWNEFHNNTSKYANSVVIDMVNQYLDELEAQSNGFVDREYLG